jgi:uncharacterized protein
VKLRVKVTPKSSRNAILGWRGDILKISVTAAPERGRANDAVETYLAERLGIRRASVRIVSGHTAELKQVEIEGIDDTEVLSRLGSSASA